MTKEEQDVFKKQLIESVETQKELNRSKNKFMAMVSTMLVGLLGLLIALKPDTIPEYSLKIAYLISLILISLGILASLIFLFSEVAYVKRVRDQQDIQMLWPDIQGLKKTSIGAILRYEKLYKFCEFSTYICLLLSIITLIVYFCMSEF